MTYPDAAVEPDRRAALRPAGPRVAIAHEWLVKYAGSERCVDQMLTEFPDARLLTTVLDPAAVPGPLARAEPSALQRLPGVAAYYHWLVPAMPLAWAARRPVSDVDLVISSSHACAKGIRVAAGIPHLCYCHTPMRYAWDFTSEQERFPNLARPAARASAAFLRRWDRWSATRVTRFLANSNAVAERIRRTYGRAADVLFPPVDTEFFTPGGVERSHFLFVGRLVAYKRPELVVQAFRDLPHRLVVVGDGHMYPRLREMAGENVIFERDVTPERLRELYRGAQALVYPCEEDFGIVMAEAQGCGTPVIALRAGGALDIVEHGRTGLLIDRLDVASVAAAVSDVARRDDLDAQDISTSAQRFSEANFRAGLRDAADDLCSSRRRTG